MSSTKTHPKKKKPKPGPDYEVRVVGGSNPFFRDAYHAFLRKPWWVAVAAIVLVFLALNGFFALFYRVFGGLAGARPGSYADAFFFSVQTMGTIGYGAMYPVTTLANVVVVAESVTSLLATALATGLVFAKFSLSSARIVFTDEVVVTPMDGVPTLMFRVGNERSSQIVEAELRISLMRTETTAEGMVFYRLYDLLLMRGRSQAFSRSWTVMHKIDEGSPLFGQTPETLAACESELFVTVMGTDDTSLQPVHARRTYAAREILFGARHVDILSETPDGHMVLDISRFHDTAPTVATETFPYPRK